MSNAFFNVLVYGAVACVGVSCVAGLTPDGKCVMIYLSMILGALMSIAKTLEK